jgi:exodeoxyribonuclease VII large subunit
LFSKYKENVEELNHYLLKNIEISILDRRRRLDHLTERLHGLSPLAILKRGYSITRTLPQRRTLRSSDETAAGEAVEIQLAHGFLRADVTHTGTKPTGK